MMNLKDGVALKGHDALTYFKGTPLLGALNISHDYDGARFLFTSDSNKAQFSEDPEAYIPQYGGFCAIAMSEGKSVGAHPTNFKIVDGRLYMFFRALFGIINTKRQWNKDETKRMKEADVQWTKLLKTENAR